MTEPLSGERSLALPSRHPEPRFDEFIVRACRVTGAAEAVLAFFEEERVWVKAGAGAGAGDTARTDSLFGRLAIDDGCAAFDDLEREPKLACTPEARTNGWRGFACAPVRNEAGEVVGAFAVADHGPHTFGADALADLADLAALVEGALTRSAAERWGRAVNALTAARESSHEGPEWLFEQSLDLMAIASVDGYFTQVSPSWTRVLGWSESELLGRPYTDFVHPDDLGPTVNEQERLEGGKDVLFFENRYRSRDGTYRWLAWKAHTSFERQAVFAVARDITEAKEAEEELRRAKEAAEAASHAKSAFLASMSHELRTPLNAILGFTKILLRPEVREVGTVERDYLRRVHSSGLHLLGLVNQVLDFNRVEAGRVLLDAEPVDVGGAAQEVLTQLEALAKDKGLELRLHVPAELAPIRTDRGHLQQVLINLVGNALKFTDTGSVEVHIETDPQTSAPLRIAVSDTGVGIPEDQLVRVFEPFVQLDSTLARRHGGTGLGLAIVRHLCEALGFEVKATSVLGKGSSFIVELYTGPAR